MTTKRTSVSIGVYEKENGPCLATYEYGRFMREEPNVVLQKEVEDCPRITAKNIGKLMTEQNGEYAMVGIMTRLPSGSYAYKVVSFGIVDGKPAKVSETKQRVV